MRKSFFNKLTCFIKDENGQAMAEYLLLLFLFTLIAYFALNLFVEAWSIKFNILKSIRAGTGGILP